MSRRSPLPPLAGIGPLLARLIVGVIMLAHGYQKLTAIGPGQFGVALGELGVPAPIVMGYVVTFTELIGGALLIIGLLSRLAALALTTTLAVAIALSHWGDPLISPASGGTAKELPLALIAGFLVVLFTGPGALSLDRLLRIEPRA